MSMHLGVWDRAYIIKLLKLIREATQKCSAASESWNKANDEFNDWYRRMFPGPREIKNYTDIKSKNLTLAAAFDEWHFWQREVLRLSAALEAEKTARDLWERWHVGGQDNPEAPGEWNTANRAHAPRQRA